MKKFVSHLLKNTQDRRKRGFTLIELLIVIGILGILVVAVLLTLNPAESQRKARDVQRIKDMGTIQAALTQYIENGGTAVASPGTGWLSPIGTPAAGALSCAGTGWLGLGVGNTLCTYINTLPNDPLAGASRACAGVGAAPNGCAAGANARPMQYRVCMAATGLFFADVRQESQANAGRVANDGGLADSWAEVTNSPAFANPVAPCGGN